MSLKNEASNYLWQAKNQNRFKNFIHTTADYEALWMLAGGDSQLAVTEHDTTAVCVWPTEEFAGLYLGKMLLSEQTQCISVDLYSFMEQLRALDEEEETFVAAFPTETSNNIISANQLLEELDAEPENY